MLHRSNAESALWNGEGSCAEAAGQSWSAARRRAGAGTWPGVVFGAGRRMFEAREDFPEPLRCVTHSAPLPA